MRTRSKPRKHRSQRGVILLMLLIALALIIIALAAAVPKMSQQIQRDRENEMIHRGAQYARAVKKFYKKFGRYPTSIEQLENTNNIRFLRKQYPDPLTPSGKWRFVRYGEVQLGQSGGSTPGAGGTGGALPGIVGGPLGQSSGGDTPPPAQGQGPGGAPGGQLGTPAGGSSFGQPAGGSSFGQPAGSPGGSFGQPSGSPGGSSFGQPAGSMFGSSGTGGVFGGGPILGVASTSEKKGIHEFDKKSKYNQWLFVYDPSLDRGAGALINGPYNPKAFMGQPSQVGTPAGQVGQPGGSIFGGQGQSMGTPTTPQQPRP